MGLNILKTTVNKFTKVVITALVSLIVISCEDNNTHHELSFDLKLTEDGRGYHHLTLDRDNWQTLHKVTGSIRDEGFGVENFWVEWKSNLYWYIGDTLGYVVKRNFNDEGMYVAYDTTYLTQFSGMEVATSNMISYSNGKGEINNMIAPVRSMVGDTMKLTASWYDGSKDFYIILN
tara:strand:+ start:868 stop:1395 length:528 start_codon:yes stop_codon:yes gene_type:complete